MATASPARRVGRLVLHRGTGIYGRRLLRAEASHSLGDISGDVTAREVLSNIAAMACAVETLSTADGITVEGVLEVHRRLLAGTRLSDRAGAIRTEQNWIGESGFNPCSAAFVPPSPEEVPDPPRRLCQFCRGEALPALAQAAIAHAQFETIHPFVDGNGRAGRALIHVLRRGLAPRLFPPISLALATVVKVLHRRPRRDALPGTSGAAAAREGHNRSVALFAAATLRAVEDAFAFEVRVEDTQREWPAALGRVRAGSAVERLLRVLPGAPVISIGAAAEFIGRSFQATNEAIRRLEEAEVVTTAHRV